MVKYQVGQDGSISAQVSRNFGVGQTYRISTSFGYAGLSDGVVKIIGIISPHDAIGDSDIEEFKRVEIDNADNDPEVIDYYSNCWWVRFKYTHYSNDCMNDYEEMSLDIGNFACHVSML